MPDDAKNNLTPKLRFPEFEGSWQKAPLAHVADFVSEKTPITKVAVEHYVSTENLLPDFDGVTRASKLPPTGSVTRYRPGDVLISNIRPYLKKIWHADREGGASNDVVVVRARDSVSRQYLSIILKNDAFVTYVMDSAKGLKMPRGDLESIRGYAVAYSSPAEQQKIFDCLTSLDAIIAAQRGKVKALLAHKKGMMQQLFPREDETLPRRRFPDFCDAGEWEKRKLGDFIVERNERASAHIPLFSLTIEAGVTAKTERYERSFLVSDETDAYKVVKPDDFAFNPMNLRFGAIGRHSGDQPVAVSKYYNIFSCDGSVNSSFCDIYFRSDVMVALYDRIATGSLIEKRRVHFDRFLQLHIAFPSPAEQQRIAACLGSLDARLAAEIEKLAALKAYKKGLMEQLFPPPEGA